MEETNTSVININPLNDGKRTDRMSRRAGSLVAGNWVPPLGVQDVIRWHLFVSLPLSLFIQFLLTRKTTDSADRTRCDKSHFWCLIALSQSSKKPRALLPLVSGAVIQN